MANELRALAALEEWSAVDALLTAVEERPNGGALLIQSATEFDCHGFPAKAETVANRALGRQAESALGVDPAVVGWALLLVHRPSEAVTHLSPENWTDLDVRNVMGALDRRGAYAVALALSGAREAALQEADWFESRHRSFERGRSTYWRAAIAAGMGEADEAIRLLRDALALGTGRWSLHCDAALRPLWGHPAFETLAGPRD